MLKLEIEQRGGPKAHLPVLIAMVGLPHSGKTTWARKAELPIVSPDAVRLAMHGKPFIPEAEPWVWVQVKTMIRALFIAGHYVVILDACNTTKKRRADWINPDWNLMFRVIREDPKVCEDRAIKNVRQDLVSHIWRMHKQWEEPEVVEAEGFIRWGDLDL